MRARVVCVVCVRVCVRACVVSPLKLPSFSSRSGALGYCHNFYVKAISSDV